MAKKATKKKTSTPKASAAKSTKATQKTASKKPKSANKSTTTKDTTKSLAQAMTSKPDKKLELKDLHTPKTITMPIRNLYLAGAAVLIAAGVGVYLYLQDDVVAVVNGRTIPKSEYVELMEQQAGQQALDQLVTEALIDSAASEQGVDISDEAIDQEFADLSAQFEERGQDIQSLLTVQGLTETDLRAQLRYQLLLEELAGFDEEASEAGVAEFIESNQDTFQEDLTEAEIQELAAEQVLNQSNQQKLQDYLATLREEASIQYLN